MKTNTQNYSNTKNSNLYKLVLTGIFAAVVAVCSWISIPLPFTQVPINLAILGVLLAGGLLGSKYGALSLIIYILIGAVGVPVFAGFGAGLGTLAGPTGGYIVGYILCSAVAGIGSSVTSKAARLHLTRHAAFKIFDNKSAVFVNINGAGSDAVVQPLARAADLAGNCRIVNQNRLP